MNNGKSGFVRAREPFWPKSAGPRQMPDHIMEPTMPPPREPMNTPLGTSSAFSAPEGILAMDVIRLCGKRIEISTLKKLAAGGYAACCLGPKLCVITGICESTLKLRAGLFCAWLFWLSPPETPQGTTRCQMQVLEPTPQYWAARIQGRTSRIG